MRSISNIKAFTLIELVIVILVLGVLVSISIPAYYNLRGDAVSAARAANAASVKSAFAIALADKSHITPNQPVPTVSEIKAKVTGSNVSASNGGILVSIGDGSYIVKTYTDSTCNNQTASSADTVQCIGDTADTI